MENTAGENVIYIKDLIFSVLHRWRSLVVAALIFGLALGGYRAVTGMQALHDEAQIAAVQADYEQAMEDYQTNRELQQKVIARLQENLKNQQDYVDNSLLMEMDSYHYYQARLVFYISTDYRILPGMTYQNPDMTTHILAAYRTLLHTPETQALLADTAGVEERYFGELFSAQVNDGSRQMSVTIMHPEQTGAEKLLEHLKTIFATVKEEISRAVYDHEVVFLEDNASLMSAGSLADTQEEALTRLEDLQTQLEEAQAALNEMTEPVLPAMASGSEVFKKTVIFFVLGCVAGAFLVTVWVGGAQLVSQKVYSAKALVSRTGVKLLGIIASDKVGNGIDRWLNRLEGRQTSDPQGRINVLVRDVANRCGGVKYLLVSGSGDPEGEDCVVQALRNAMPGVEVLHLGSVLHSAEAIDGLAKADAVLLVEQCGTSRYADVAEQCRKVADYNKQLLGCILVGG